MIETFKKIRSIHILIGVMLLLTFVVLKSRPWQHAGEHGKLISWDITSYYGYLPATFIENDLELEFIEGNEAYYHNQMMYWPETAPNGGKVIKTTMGLSYLYAPFFFIADMIDEDDSMNRGFSETFEFWLTLSSLFYSILGAIFLRLFLLRHFSDNIVSATLISVYLGTNLYYYITVEPLMPHAYNFFLFSLFIFLTDRWHANPKVINSVLLGATLGLIILIRPVNGIIFLFFITYHLNSLKEFKVRMKLFYSRIGTIALIGLFAFLMILPQLLYWHKITGHFIFNSYPGENFFFGNPHILDGLFSYRKGWLLYTPLMTFAIIGIWFNVKNRTSTLLVIIPCLYLMFSWWNWWYGGSFGCRPIIDFYPILSIGLAAFLQRAWNSGNWSKITSLIVFGILITYNQFQTLQKKSDAIHWDSMTKAAYWHNFLHRYPQPGFEEKLQSPDVEAAKKGLDEY